MKNKHQEILSSIDSTLTIVDRLMGGMSNYTYLVTNGEEKYVFRIPGEGAENFVDNYIEEKKDVIKVFTNVQKAYLEKKSIITRLVYPSLDSLKIFKSKGNFKNSIYFCC